MKSDRKMTIFHPERDIDVTLFDENGFPEFVTITAEFPCNVVSPGSSLHSMHISIVKRQRWDITPESRSLLYISLN
jgi:hypothetical protein